MILVALDGPVIDIEAAVNHHATQHFGLTRTPEIGPAHARYRDWPMNHRGAIEGYARDVRRGERLDVLQAAPQAPHAARILTVLYRWGFLAGYLDHNLDPPAGTLEEWLERNHCPAAPIYRESSVRAAVLADAVGVVTADPSDAVRLSEAGVRAVLLQHRHPTRVRHTHLSVATEWRYAAATILGWPELREEWDARREGESARDVA